MNTTEYRDEISTLRDSISAFKACVSFEERERAADYLGRAWRRLALLEQPKRLPQAEKDKCQRTMNQAAAILNDWLIEVQSGDATAEKPRAEPPAKAMADTMRFCATAKRYGF